MSDEHNYRWGVDPLPDELWEAYEHDNDLNPRDDFDDIWLTEYEEEGEGRFPEWDDEPDWRRH